MCHTSVMCTVLDLRSEIMLNIGIEALQKEEIPIE